MINTDLAQYQSLAEHYANLYDAPELAQKKEPEHIKDTDANDKCGSDNKLSTDWMHSD